MILNAEEILDLMKKNDKTDREVVEDQFKDQEETFKERTASD